ncbi:MAG: HAMP domain-containing histidine kinase [Rhodospirillaceae bacterium]|jgi:signal transduction histidine kinase|nr:HAMP domain-containing histidine kinase [Rhodospirillaceae bacterium]
MRLDDSIQSNVVRICFKVVAVIIGIIDILVPVNLNNDPGLRTQCRVLIVLSYFFALVSISTSNTISSENSASLFVYALHLFSIILFLMPIALRLTGNLGASCWIFIGVTYAFVLVASIINFSFPPLLSPASILLPFLVAYFVDTRAGIIAVIAIFFTAFMLIILDNNSLLPQFKTSERPVGIIFQSPAAFLFVVAFMNGVGLWVIRFTRNTEREQKKLDRIKRELIAVVSHELRTPITSVRGAIKLVQSGTLGDLNTDQKNMLDIAERNSERLIKLANSILDIEKIETGKLDIIFSDIDIMELVQESITLNQMYAQEYKVKFELMSEPSKIIVAGNAERLTQVITNLLSNAAKFSHPDTSVEIDVRPNNNNVRVAVKDYGRGIPLDFHDQIFEKFTQSDSSDRREASGFGLGLNISKEIIELHNGVINFESVPGKGSTFYFELPLKQI